MIEPPNVEEELAHPPTMRPAERPVNVTLVSASTVQASISEATRPLKERIAGLLQELAIKSSALDELTRGAKGDLASKLDSLGRERLAALNELYKAAAPMTSAESLLVHGLCPPLRPLRKAVDKIRRLDGLRVLEG